MDKYINVAKANVKDIYAVQGECYVEDVQAWLDEQPAADVIERSVYKKMLENAMNVPKPMHLYILFADGRVEKHLIKRFSDLSQTKSRLYYYEEPNDELGKGKTFRRDDIQTFEVSFCPSQGWEELLKGKE